MRGHPNRARLAPSSLWGTLRSPRRPCHRHRNVTLARLNEPGTLLWTPSRQDQLRFEPNTRLQVQGLVIAVAVDVRPVRPIRVWSSTFDPTSQCETAPAPGNLDGLVPLHPANAQATSRSDTI